MLSPLGVFILSFVNERLMYIRAILMKNLHNILAHTSFLFLSSAEEYLLSAGNRMSRKQLRHCLRNTKALYEEFWVCLLFYILIELPLGGGNDDSMTF